MTVVLTCCQELPRLGAGCFLSHEGVYQGLAHGWTYSPIIFTCGNWILLCGEKEVPALTIGVLMTPQSRTGNLSIAFELLDGAKMLTELDLRNSYHLVRIKEGDERKMAFNTPTGYYEHLVMPFHLTNAPAVFQYLINEILQKMLNLFVFVYFTVLIPGFFP